MIEALRRSCTDRFRTAGPPPTLTAGPPMLPSKTPSKTSAQQLDPMWSPNSPRKSYSGLPLGDFRSVAQRPTETGTGEVHLKLCVSRGVESIHWGEIKLGDTYYLSVNSDTSLFGTYTRISYDSQDEACFCMRPPTIALAWEDIDAQLQRRPS